MQKRLIKTLLLALLAVSLQAQLTDSTYSHVAYWTVGDTINYRYTEEEHKFEFADKIDSTITAYDYSLRIHQENDTTYRMVLRSGENYETTDPIMKLLQDSMYECSGTDIIYTASGYGNYQTILNLPEVSDLTNSCIKTTMQKFKLPSAMIDQALKETTRDFRSPAKFISSESGVPIALYHSFFGKSYSLYDTIFYQEEMNTIEGSSTITGDAYFLVYDVDTTLQHLFFKNVIDLDPIALRRSAIHRTLMGRARGDFEQLNLRGDSEEEIRQEFADVDFRMEIVKVYKIHYPTGYPLEIYMKKTTRTGDFDSDNEYWDNTIINTHYLDFISQQRPITGLGE